jgi:hypothetical protein
MENVLSDLLRQTMQRMVSSVPLADLVRKVTSDHSGSKIGELRELVESLLETYGIELQVFRGATSVFHSDIHEMQRHQFALRVQGTSVRTVMSRQSDASAEKFSSTDGYLEVRNNDCAVFVPSGHNTLDRHGDTGLVDALTKLRVRREVKGFTVETSHRFRSLNMMTEIECAHQEDETEPVVYDRFCGVLGEAEHRGRLIMF